ncbi:hypothetical protein L7F22_035550 [Adiantum nelumboides]|nr:hypothetical protein [Adiantum nelumboides]
MNFGFLGSYLAALEAAGDDRRDRLSLFKPLTDVDVHDVVDEEWAENEQARSSHHAFHASDCYALAISNLLDIEEPLSFDEAQNSKNWMAPMQSKYDALIENDTWTLCDLPFGKKAVGTKWVYKLKRNPNGEIDRYKARLVAKGYAQQIGIDYEETFAPTYRMTTVHFLCALAAYFGRYVHYLDIVTAFLNGDIFEEVYVTQLCGFVKKGQEDKVYKCNKTTYGLKQSPRAWYAKADTHLVKRSFCNSPTESTLYVKREGNVLLIVVLYVDDLLITGPNERHIADHYLDVTLYQIAVGCLIYVCNTRPDIQFAVSQDTTNTIYIDSPSAFAVARNPVFHARTKHNKVHYHYVRERLSTREISLAYVPTQDNLADLFTKALSREKLEAFCNALGLLPFVN